MASHSTGHTISPKENIIYSIAVSNSGRRSKTVTVYDSVPANTTYVEGADANEAGALSWNITVPSGKSVVVSYTVKVNDDMPLCDGGIVPATVASVSTLVATTNDVYIERTFNSYDAQYADLAIDAMIGSEYFEDNVLAKHIYTVICSQNPISAITGESLSATLTAIMNGTAEAEVLDLVAPTLYGGKGHTGAISGVKGLPAESVSARDLVSGDIILTKNGSTYESYIYSNNGVFALKQSDEDVDKGEFLSSLVDMDLYAVIRPSTLLINYTPTDLDEERDVLTEKQQIIVATAKYYLLRGDWLQYDDSYFCNNNTEIGNESRWQYATHAPEEYTEDMTGYINCAAFTHDIYWTVFGEKLPGGMYTTANYATNASKNNMLVYSFTRTAGQSHAEAEMEKVSKEFLSCLQPGDILVIRRGTSSGHAMLYIGNGAFIHSSGSSYNYGGSYGVETYEPTIRFHKVNDYFLNATSTNGYIFGTKVTGLYVVRPLQNTTWANKSVTEASLNRYENMQGIVAQKLSSIKENVTVNPGDEITYTLSIYNTNNYAVTLDVTDVVPANTVFVSSDENAVVSGNSLAWVVSIAPRETVELSFTVKVSGYAAYGAEISSGGAMIGGVPFATYDTLVKSTLYEDEQQSLIDAYEQLKSEGTTLRGLALANEIYYRALGINNIFGNTDVAYVMEDETEGVFTPEGLGLLGNGKQAHQRNNGSRYEELLVNSIYGGRGLASTPNEGIRTRLAKEEHLIVGDIYIGRTSSAYVVYMYLGGDTFISLTTMKADTVDISGRLERGPAYSYYYAVLRPSYYFE
ncbi:MAG: DUF11 domain-containing protein [Clostridia bacterium]|nr:DUF11 domain-containing protein [Clostridia bacterium]